VLPGVSHPAGILGNACGFVEMVRQLGDGGGHVPETVFITAATGTTFAGFLLAERALRDAGFPRIRVVGVQVYPGRLRASVRLLSRWVSRVSRGRLAHDFPIEVDSSSLCGGFGRFSPELGRLCERVRSDTDLALDPIFGGKTWSAMERHLEQNRSRDGRMLFWHCGYTPEWGVLGRRVPSEATT
jgi:D-cysteine desulfhydrase